MPVTVDVSYCPLPCDSHLSRVLSVKQESDDELDEIHMARSQNRKLNETGYMCTNNSRSQVKGLALQIVFYL